MIKKVKIEQPQDTATKPGEEPGAEDQAPETAGRAGEPAADENATEEVGAPATEGEGPSIEELVPGFGEALQREEAERARMAELEAETAQLKDRLLRALAEVENMRRRSERDRKDAETYGGTRLARDLLAVYDNLTRALAAADDEIREKHGSFLEGVELTQRELLNAFSKHRIQLVEPGRGEKFDPNRHQAMFEAPVPGAPGGTVIEVMQPGFMIAERLLRPAMVGVARGGEAAPTAEPEPEAEETTSSAEGGETS